MNSGSKPPYLSFFVRGTAGRWGPTRTAPVGTQTWTATTLILVTLAPSPKKRGVTHWSSRLLAQHLGTGYGAVARVWREHAIPPWRAETFKFSTDP